MAACAAACDAEHVLLLEDDWPLVTKPAALVRHRMRAAMQTLALSSQADSSAAPLLGVHLRHKLLFGAPFYELVTAAQHNEPPSAYAAWYFSDDPVADRFPEGLWQAPFWDSRELCDSRRTSWRSALAFQHDAARAAERARPEGAPGAPPPELPETCGSGDAPCVWWCANDSSLLCASTAAHRDPFRSLMYSTNPMLYRTATWQLHLASHAAILQDLRAVEESVSASYMWRVQPSFTIGLSLGLFRHHRLDRTRIPPVEEDADAAACVARHATTTSPSA
eukprot:TRINITY_DN66074_c0_g1_i1.p1 TRINITY_DN66074_c0_g1~~TRINITY_DN66074_c0_g1_i1.p1  ORF type:complete len:288 (-),score=52.60 TRINITY_DN66074_c0_g1_i1:141-977(-)